MIVKSFQRSLLLIVAALALPLVILIVFAVRTSLDADRHAVEQQALDRAEQIDALSDTRVEADLAALAVLSVSNTIRFGEWQAAYERARRVADINPHWRTLILSDLTAGEEIFNLKKPYSETRSPIDPIVRAEAKPNQAVAGSVRRDGPGCPCVYLHYPVQSDGEKRYVLTVGVDPAVFQVIMMARTPEGSVSAVVDRHGRFIGRSIDYADRVGTPATQYVRGAVEKGGQGFYEGKTYEGFANYTAYHTSPLTGWSTHMAVPLSQIDTPRFFSAVTLIAGTLVVLGIAVLIVIYALRDLALRRRDEQALFQAQKMEALGRLTGGVTHDFNNLLTVIIGGLDMLERRLEDSKLKRLAANALEAANRSAQLVQQLLAFSRGQSIEIGAVDAGQVLANMDDLLRRTLGSDIRLSVDVNNRARWVMSNAHQLEMAILNLAINARDAMPNGGTLAIETCASDQDPSQVEIRISDTGTGMAPDVVARALEPFFTTKEGKGSGLGLAQVFGIVRQSGGTMSIDSTPRKGTRITLMLPRAEPSTEAARQAEPTVLPAPSKQGYRILLADDDPTVRTFFADVLRDAGYDVREAEDGVTALKAADEAPPDILVADYSMPGMNGVQLAQYARDIWPNLPVIIVSGYSDAEAVKGALPGAALLLKPFSAGELLLAVGKALPRKVPA